MTLSEKDAEDVRLLAMLKRNLFLKRQRKSSLEMEIREIKRKIFEVKRSLKGRKQG